MTGDLNLDKVQPPREAHSGGDNLQGYRDAGQGVGLVQLKANTADQHLQPMMIVDQQGGPEAPYNPQHIPGTYKPEDIAIANQHFNKDQVRALESNGPQNFNQMMEAVKNAPTAQSEALVKQFKFMADQVIKFEREHPNLKPNHA